LLSDFTDRHRSGLPRRAQNRAEPYSAFSRFRTLLLRWDFSRHLIHRKQISCDHNFDTELLRVKFSDGSEALLFEDELGQEISAGDLPTT
jgi:hypothetical protein